MMNLVLDFGYSISLCAVAEKGESTADFQVEYWTRWSCNNVFGWLSDSGFYFNFNFNFNFDFYVYSVLGLYTPANAGETMLPL